MKDMLEALVKEVETAGCIAAVDDKQIPKSNGVNWRRLTLMVGDKDMLASRPLLAILIPPTKYPVTVDYYHADPQQVTGHRYEWGRDPNLKHLDNPPTIDNKGELQKVLRGLMDSAETTMILSRLAC